MKLVSRDKKQYCISFYLVKPWFIAQKKKVEEVDFVSEKCLHKKIDSKDVHINYGVVYILIMVSYTRYSRRYDPYS